MRSRRPSRPRSGPDVVAPDHYNGAAYAHEHVVAKYCTVLGTSLAAVVAHEDRVALAYFRARPDVAATRVASIGLSGGGLRSALLRATSDDLGACAIVGMYYTHEGLLDGCVATHTWMLFPPSWSRRGDWPDLAASAAPAPLLVQYALDDPLFTVAGMRAADARIAGCPTASVGAPDAYRGEFHPGGHRFYVPMQQNAISWLRERLGPERPDGSPNPVLRAISPGRGSTPCLGAARSAFSSE